MRRLAAIGLCAIGAMAIARPASAQPRVNALTYDEYVRELDSLHDAIAALREDDVAGSGQVAASVASTWYVADGDRTWHVSMSWVRDALTAWRAKPVAADRARLVAGVAALRAQAGGYRAAPAPGPDARAALADVLASPEFRAVHDPSWLDRLRQRVLRWLVDLLGAILGSSAMPTLTNLAVYVLIAAAIAVIAVSVYRSLRRSAHDETVALDLEFTPVRPWSDWLAEARAAAARGDTRAAVRAVYWCAITFLETQGAWRADPSRTPREYVRLLAASSAHTPALRGLTRLLEQVWYGSVEADDTRYAEALEHLKSLGCPSH
jgi:hypothetical protein